MNSNGNDRPVSDGGFANTPSKAPFRALDLPLAGLRIVTTRPPLNWFGGVDFDFATEMAEELRALGAAVFELDVRGFIFPNRDYVKAITQELRSFRPDVAMALPNATYALLVLQRPGSKHLPQTSCRSPSLCSGTTACSSGRGGVSTPCLKHRPSLPQDRSRSSARL